jgi:enoyl-CoA hydratase/carnithine racemase
MPFQHLLVKHEGDLATITLNRPEKRNALSLEVMQEVTAAFQEVASSDALGVILAANGPVFSAGHNFADMAGTDLAAARQLFQVCTAMMDTIQAIPQPVLAKVHALATAAGCQLVATCDLAVASEDAGFALPGGKGGLFCHTPLVAVARNVGRKRALELALTGDVIDAETAADWGLVNRVVPADQLDDAAHDLITRCLRGSAFAKGIGKQTYYAQIDLPQPQAYEHAIEVMAANALTPDAQEGIASFLEKRKPHFTQRP